jgi:VWFA-related protein
MLHLPLLLLLAAEETATFRAGVNLVHIDVEVRQGERTVEGLTKDDFRVTDNGRAQTILSAASVEEPLDVILLLDTSASMEPVMERVARAARTALGQLREGDRVAVMAFDEAPELVADFTGDFAAVEQTIRERVLTRSFPRNTQIQRAVDAAALLFHKPSSHPAAGGRRRAVLIVTDNLGMRREGQALPHLWEADAVLSGVIVRSPAMTGIYSVYFPPALVGVGGMGGLAEKSGGDTIKMDDAGEGLRQMIQRLRLRYSLYYAMPEGKDGEERKVRVALTGEAGRRHRDAKVRARAGYRVP